MNIELTDGIILLRPWREEDIDALYEAASESIKEISTWMPWCHPNYKREESAAYIMSRDEAWKNDTEYGFAIFDVETKTFLGSLGLNHIRREWQMANLGYWIRTGWTGRGIASRATRLGARFAIEQLGLQRIEIVASVGNLPSQRVAEKAGALREAVLRKRLLVNGQPHDAVMFSLVAEDLEQADR
ncbi:MAG: GNAT family N-acetyltransferase [Pyrinomonadaceae bacterium]|nr:GNAT family N-acetyltransferase [Pyrinomonadaceae bacterium]